MAKKSKLLAEIGEQMKNLTTGKIEELNIDISEFEKLEYKLK